ncbi:MAG: T9SS type A sorting domain-containing protein [Ignavibacteria bacterium]|nr:T9SS type A sorting domain-containing protein [Ignavibacteria bacterium]
MSSFVSVVNGSNVTLSWTTTSEKNNFGFEIERRAVNSQWITAGTVQGNGTTITPVNYSFTDRGLSSGVYDYRLKQTDFNGNFKYYSLNSEVIVGIPINFSLSQNYPNPFNPSTKINYDLPFDGKVTLKIFDISGREVSTLINEFKTAGYYTIDFKADNLSSGIYLYKLTSNSQVLTRKMLIVK